MQDIWRLSAADFGSPDKVQESFGQGSWPRRRWPGLTRSIPSINAVVDHRPEDVLAQAAAVDAKLARNEDVGALAGVPVTLKVNIDQAGFANTNGLKLQRDTVARSNSPRGRIICARPARSSSGAPIVRRFPIAGSPPI